MMLQVSVSIIGLLLVFLRVALAFDATRNDNLAVYYGQNSYGATNAADRANWQQGLSTYCQDDTIDTFPLAFLTSFTGQGGLPSLDLANTCSGTTGLFNGTALPNCQFMAADIMSCQASGKLITLSLGGATGSASFTSDSDATTFANTLWDLFFEGNSSTRPFGTAVLDGVDLDIEGGSTSYYQTFLDTLQTHFKSGSKRYYTTAAPQCPFPDAYLGNVINSSPFDAVYVQFYNNFCGVTKFNNSNAWNFGQWDNWAKTQSPNPNVKVYIGAPGGPMAANQGSYVDVNTLGNIAIQTRQNYSSFGGIMLWDVSQAYANNRYDLAIKNLITGGSPPATTTPLSTTTTRLSTTTKQSSSASTKPRSTSTTKPLSTAIPSPSNTTRTSSSTRKSSSTTISPVPTPVPTVSCVGVSAWVTDIPYVGGNQVVYNGHLWTAKWWSYDSVPGGSAGDWTDDGPCPSDSGFAAAQGQTRYCFLSLR
ncbi:glycoside hydrolase [Thelephora terrestris]|uniref:chitinase n=1 Tax=Thelephora terrestris TaxID=56493 RepID=A0A9P6HIB2_9AGAM|nr:glycoside hydrolase [Thelephora terrestris]